MRHEVQTLSLSHEVSDATLLCALSLDARYRETDADSLLRRARLMFIAQYPERFATELAVAFPGYLETRDERQVSPFWDSVGQHFFDRDFNEINQMAGVRSKSFIAEVMPPFPLYLPLLTPQARAAIGRENPRHEYAMQEMLAEGFSRSRHVDIFDAGPLLLAECERLHTFKQRLGDFRCVLARYALTPTGQLMLTPQQAEVLGVEEGRAVLAVPMPLPTMDEGEL